MPGITIRAGGQAGDGIASIGDTLAKSLTRMGLHLFGLNAYQSVIRGGHVWHQARASTERVYTQGDDLDLLYALDRQTAEVHLPNLSKGGTVVFDPEKFAIADSELPVGTHALAVPTLEIARKYTPQSILQNAGGMGALAYLAGIPLDGLRATIADSFGRKSGDVVDWNLGAASDGYAFAKSKGAPNAHAVSPNGPPKMLMTGNEAIALGAAAAGCKFLAQYPMTPASTVMHWMAKHSKALGVVVKQAEDEIAAINMAIGASFAGVRSMTATSGGGFSLMVEALGMAGMTETPLVVVESQRSGPSTGLPTKTEQGDLHLMLGAGQGEFPRAILAPSTPAEAFRLTVKAFELAEAWQTPILLASDFHLSECSATVEPDEIRLDPPVPSLRVVEPNGHDYKRYQYTPSGVSPRALPGQPGLNFIAASDEHDEKGHLISDVKAGLPLFIAERERMMRKRMSKLDGLAKATSPPTIEGAEKPLVTFVAWGSTVAAVRDAMRILAARNLPARLIAVETVYPLHAEAIASALRAAPHPILVEANYSGQLGRLIRAETGIALPDRLLKFDGEPFYPMEIVRKAMEVTGRVGQ